jgi:hypothetical protein
MDSRMTADPRSNDDLLDATRAGDEGALALLFERHRDRLERMVRLRVDARLQGRVDSADVLHSDPLSPKIQGCRPVYFFNPARICRMAPK